MEEAVDASVSGSLFSVRMIKPKACVMGKGNKEESVSAAALRQETHDILRDGDKGRGGGGKRENCSFARTLAAASTMPLTVRIRSTAPF